MQCGELTAFSSTFGRFSLLVCPSNQYVRSQYRVLVLACLLPKQDLTHGATQDCTCSVVLQRCFIP